MRFAERLFDFPRLYGAKFALTGALLRVTKPLLFTTSVSVDELLAAAGIAPGASVCEIGCGDGENYRLVASMVPNVSYTGVDINPAMVRACTERYPAQRWLVATPPYAFADRAFDVCLIVNVLHHLESREQARAMLREARRIAALTLLFEPLQSDGAVLAAIKRAYWALTDGGNEYLRLAEMRAMLAETGAAPRWERASAPLRHFYGAQLTGERT